MLNTKLGKAYGGQLFWKIWNRIDIEQLAKVWKISDWQEIAVFSLNFQTFADCLILMEFKKFLNNWAFFFRQAMFSGI